MWGSHKIGVGAAEGADPHIVDCEVYEGWNAGVAFSGLHTRGRLERSVVSSNEGPGVHVTDGADPRIDACRIHGGSSVGVAISGAGTLGRLEHCDVFLNRGNGVQVGKAKIHCRKVSCVCACACGQCMWPT